MSAIRLPGSETCLRLSLTSIPTEIDWNALARRLSVGQIAVSLEQESLVRLVGRDCIVWRGARRCITPRFFYTDSFPLANSAISSPRLETSTLA